MTGTITSTKDLPENDMRRLECPRHGFLPLRRSNGAVLFSSGGRPQVVHRRLYALGLVRHARERQSHFHARQRAEQRQIVDVAQMADAEGAASGIDYEEDTLPLDGN